ncbi:dehydrodolichyl diphosphate synthase CPT3-like [Andrographis paniculata]|uniref:dehydrodolichyl diphosphate synthase CPT3-like n=1 Tax=Andrographis paniculata TaxID=175694 RepID=UPI0021E6E116|nr:dehydrodolichyl diphosphate synthase CPT3-like [Andrographis paniculata]XP_051145483.1 dehydrodolichyl diphosphate synthase CPT3-like [Andrographis paniculata]XP_051145484.1 dehydrodolichyl diphosphate synthase CPT3-like [Andrographis paniculata]
MEKPTSNPATQLIEGLVGFLRRSVSLILLAGPVPRHVAFIMDGNRRYAKKNNLEEGAGHRAGSLALMNMLKYCYELNVKCVTIYAFSIDNFKRRPDEVQSTMELIQEKIEALLEKESIVNHYGVKVHFSGNLDLLSETVRSAANRVMRATSNNSKRMLSICIAYTSRDEIVHAVEESCKEKQNEFFRDHPETCGLGGLGENTTSSDTPCISIEDVEKHMYMAIAPDPDIIIRTSGETRLSNFLLWQSTRSLLYSPGVLWPGIGFWHLVQAILLYQRNSAYFEKKGKQI